MSISGLRKASWYNPDDGTVVQANDIAEDGEFYTRAIEDPDDQTPTGESPYAGDESYCELMVFDMSLLPQLKAWQESDTRISMVAAGVQQNIQWYERDLVNVKPVYPVAAGRRNHINVVMERTGHGAHDVHGNVNLLAHLGTTADPWTDADGDGLADGYINNGFRNLSFDNNEQSITTDPNKNYNTLSENFLFPIQGLKVLFRIENLSLANTGKHRVRLRTLNYSNSSLSNYSVTAQVGVVSIDTNLFSSTYLVQTRIAEVENATSGNTFSIKLPSVRVDGSDKYVSY